MRPRKSGTGSVARSLHQVLTGALLAFVPLLFLSCGGAGVDHPMLDRGETVSNQLAAADVQNLITAAAAATSDAYVIAVTDRGGNILGIYVKPGAPATVVGDFGVTWNTNEQAVGLARTAAFFSNNQAPLSSRTVRMISGKHFPPDIMFTGAAALYGIENTNRGCSLNVTYLPGKTVNPARTIGGAIPGTGIVTGKVDDLDSDALAVNPGGVPIFHNNEMVGGIGVAGTTPAVAEYAAFHAIAATGFVPNVPPPGVVVIDGVNLPFVNQTTIPAGSTPGTANGAFTMGPVASPGPVPSGDLITISNGPIGGLTATEVQGILDQAVTTANTERALIRLPLGQPAKFAIAVADLDGTLIGLRRMEDATVFSLDVAAAKARNVVYFSSQSVNPADLPGVPAGTAVTNRTIGFGGQPFFPSGIDGSAPGPFFQLFQYDLANPCTNGRQPPNANQSGIVFFPGSVPLYKNGVMVGGLGVSGDGVDQDDYDTAQAATGFDAPPAIRADQIIINNVRLPYLKFPRNPTL